MNGDEVQVATARPPRSQTVGLEEEFFFSTSLVPVDIAHPETAIPAIERAVVMARASGSTVRLIYIEPVTPFSFVALVPPPADDTHTHAEQRLGVLAGEIRLPKARISSTVRISSIYGDVLDEAERIRADLIVVGLHRSGMARYLLD